MAILTELGLLILIVCVGGGVEVNMEGFSGGLVIAQKSTTTDDDEVCTVKIGENSRNMLNGYFMRQRSQQAQPQS